MTRTQAIDAAVRTFLRRDKQGCYWVTDESGYLLMSIRPEKHLYWESELVNALYFQVGRQFYRLMRQ